MITNIKMLKYFLAIITVIFLSNTAAAHCDSIEGPVVKASQKSLETGNINYVLIWVREEDEKEITDMFEKVNIVRTLSPEARELVDLYFYETVVRIHRMGEGVGYTGLKPAGYKPEIGIEAADVAIEKDSVNEILGHLDESKHSEILKYFNKVQKRKNYDVNNVKAGREFVAAYVHFIHYVETMFNGDEMKDEHHHHQ